MSSETQVHEIEGIGEFRAREGTAVGVIAGATKYWSDRAKKAERANESRLIKGYVIGWLTGAAIVSVIHYFHIFGA